ncbi:hypothetical protein Esti_000896 [Eimeria stiedai]
MPFQWARGPRIPASGRAAQTTAKADDGSFSNGFTNSRSGNCTIIHSSNGNTKLERCLPLGLATEATSAVPAPAITAVAAGRRGATPAVFRTRLAAVRRSSPLRAPVSCHPSYNNCGCFFSTIAACAARSGAATVGAAAATSVEKPTLQSAQPASTLAARAGTGTGPCPVEIKPTAPHFNSSSSCYCYRCSKCSRKPCSALLPSHSSRRSLLTFSSPPAAAAAPIAAIAAAPPQQSMPLFTQQQHELQQQQPREPAQQRQVQNKDEGGRYQQQREERQEEAEDPLLLRAMRTHAFLHLVSGAVAGAVSRTATAPLDRLKVMLQLQPSPIPFRHAARVIMHQEVTAKTAAAGAAAEAAALVKRSSSMSPGGSDSLPGSSQRQLQGQPQQPQQQPQQQQRTGRAAGLQSTAGSTSYIRGSSSKNRLLLCGWQGFFRGNLTNCLKVVPETAIKFYTYDLCKHALARRKQQQLLQQQQQQLQQQQMQTQHQMLLQQEPHLQLRERFVCGAAAGLCAQLLIYPMELVKTRLAAYSPGCMYSGVLQCFKAIYQEGGIRRLYRGLAPSLLGVIPYAGIDLAVFESLKEAYIQRIAPPRLQLQHGHKKPEACSSCNSPSAAPWKQTAPCNAVAAISDAAAVEQEQLRPLGASATSGSMGAQGASRCRCCCDAGSSSGPITPPALALLLMGGCSSLLGQVVAYPTALIRTRMQVDGSGGKQLQYRSSAAAAAVALKQGGLRGLYRGLGANCCKALPAVSLSWIAYEKTKEAIRWVEGFWSERIADGRDANAAAATRFRHQNVIINSS